MTALSDRSLVVVLSGATDLVDPTLCSEIREAGARTLQVNVSDVATRAGLKVAALDPPIDAVVTVSGHSDHDGGREERGLDADAVHAALSARGRIVGGWWTEVEAPDEPEDTPQGQRLDVLAQVALLRRPAAVDEQEWVERWKGEHTRVAQEHQGAVAHVQHRVMEEAWPGSPDVAAVVEEHFPMEAVSDPHAYFGSGGDPDELERRMSRMVTSIERLGADDSLDRLDVVPTSRYRWVFPSAEELTSRP
jgi:hypothetical protein